MLEKLSFADFKFIIDEAHCESNIANAKNRVKKYQKDINKWKLAHKISYISFFASLPMLLIVIIAVTWWCYNFDAMGWFVAGMMLLFLTLGGIGCWTEDRVGIAETNDFTRLLNNTTLFYVYMQKGIIDSVQIVQDAGDSRLAVFQYSINSLYTIKDIRDFRIKKADVCTPEIDFDKRIIRIANPSFESIKYRR